MAERQKRQIEELDKLQKSLNDLKRRAGGSSDAEGTLISRVTRWVCACNFWHIWAPHLIAPCLAYVFFARVVQRHCISSLSWLFVHLSQSTETRTFWSHQETLQKSHESVHVHFFQRMLHGLSPVKPLLGKTCKLWQYNDDFVFVHMHAPIFETRCFTEMPVRPRIFALFYPRMTTSRLYGVHSHSEPQFSFHDCSIKKKKTLTSTINWCIFLFQIQKTPKSTQCG